MKTGRIFLYSVVLALLLSIAAGWTFGQPELITIEGTDPRLNTVYWTADGALVVTVSDERVEAWDIVTGEKAAETTEPLLVDFPLTYRHVSQPLAWTSDGAYAAVVAEDRRAILVYARGGSEPITRIGSGEDRAFRGVVWRHGAAVLVPEYDSFIDSLPIYDALDGAVVAEIAVAGARTTAANPTFSPDGSRLALTRFSMGVSSVVVYAADTFAEEQVIYDEIAFSAPVMIQWLSDQDLFVGMNPDGERGIFNIRDGTWRALPAPVFAWSPNGMYGARLSEGSLVIVEAATGDVVSTLALPAYDPEVARLTWGAGGIAVYRSLPLTLYPTEMGA
jgi:WD40 repeat protein